MKRLHQYISSYFLKHLKAKVTIIIIISFSTVHCEFTSLISTTRKDSPSRAETFEIQKDDLAPHNKTQEPQHTKQNT